jgi:hypothetical protein
MAFTNSPNGGKAQNKRKLALIAILSLLVIVAVVLTLRGCSKDEGSGGGVSKLSGVAYDANATVGGWDEEDTEEIIDSLNEKVEAGMINISMNTTPVFSGGKSKGNLMIVNEGVNLYPQVVEITRNDTGAVIYTSGAIPVGSKIETAVLDVDLPRGVYDCTALFYSVDPVSGANLGCAGAVITITILE